MKKSLLRRVDTPHGRVYLLEEDGEQKFLPSVTTILSYKASSYLADLEKAIGKEELERIGNRAALRGTAMHKFLENYLICLKKKGDSDSCLLYTQRKSTDSLLHDMEKERVDVGRSLFYNVYHSGILDRIKKVIFTEQFLYSTANLFAGTSDFGYLDTKNQIVVTDFKSASTPRNEDIVSKYKCQAAAYAIAFEEMYEKPVQRGEIWISYPDGLQIEEVAGEEMEKYKQEFKDLCVTFHSMWDIEPFKNFVQNTNI